jgi:DNA gyrase subunit A
MSDLRNGEQVIGAISLEPTLEEGFLFFITAGGDVKRIRVADLPGLTAHAFTVMNVGEDQLVGAHFVSEEDEAILVTSEAQSIRFKVSEVRPTGLPAGGMRGIRIADTDRVVSATLTRYGTDLWVITEGGIAKSTPLSEYPVQGRAGAGVSTMKLMPGERLAASTIATANDLVVILTARGKFKVVKFRGVPNGPRNITGDFAISLSKTDRVTGLTQIVHRPTVQPILSHEPGSNGSTEPAQS